MQYNKGVLNIVKYTYIVHIVYLNTNSLAVKKSVAKESRNYNYTAAVNIKLMTVICSFYDI